MSTDNAFSKTHPLALTVYYLSVLTVAVFSSNPVFTALTVTGGLLYTGITSERKAFLKALRQYLFMAIILTLLNPLFSHHGSTPLFFMNSKPVTLEAVIYGIHMSLTLTGVLMWCHALSDSFTSDKVIYLIGKPFPRLAMTVSMSLRFIPLFKEEYMNMHSCQKAMGMYSSDNIVDKVRCALKLFSAEITRALENSVDTANSMKSRGYGLQNRTSFSLYKFNQRDIIFLFGNIMLITVVIFTFADKSTYFFYYPNISVLPVSYKAITAYIAYGFLTLFPFITELREVIVWKYLRSKI